jgi:hypothetical protein
MLYGATMTNEELEIAEPARKEYSEDAGLRALPL